MSNGIEASISALQALGRRQAVSANNLANANSENYKTTTAHLEEGAAGSVRVQTGIDQTPGLRESAADGSSHEMSNVDIAQELTDMLPTKTYYAANLKALQVTDEMTGDLLDFKA